MTTLNNGHKTNLPKHLCETLNAYHGKCEAFGIDPDWASKAYDKAVAEGNDFNSIHALVK